MGKLIQFPMSRVRRPRRAQVDVFARHFELLNSRGLYDRMFVVGFACVTLLSLL